MHRTENTPYLLSVPRTDGLALRSGKMRPNMYVERPELYKSGKGQEHRVSPLKHRLWGLDGVVGRGVARLEEARVPLDQRKGGCR